MKSILIGWVVAGLLLVGGVAVARNCITNWECFKECFERNGNRSGDYCLDVCTLCLEEWKG